MLSASALIPVAACLATVRAYRPRTVLSTSRTLSTSGNFSTLYTNNNFSALNTNKNLSELSTNKYLPELTTSENMRALHTNAYLRDLSTNRHLRKLSTNKYLRELNPNENLRKLFLNGYLHDLTTNRNMRELNTNGVLRELTTYGNMRELIPNDNLRNPSTNEKMREVIPSDNLRESSTNENLKELISKGNLRNLSTNGNLRILSTKDYLHLFATNGNMRHPTSKGRMGKLTTKMNLHILNTNGNLHEIHTKEHLGNRTTKRNWHKGTPYRKMRKLTTDWKIRRRTTKGILRELTTDNQFRVQYGEEDTTGKYPYILAVLTKNRTRTCTATLIAPSWVLCAAHCDTGAYVQYGDMTVPRDNITDIRDIIQTIPHPGYKAYRFTLEKHIYSDISLMLIKEIKLDEVARLSGLDYRSLMGYRVEYAGFGITNTSRLISANDQVKPLQLGTGMVAPCRDIQVKLFYYPQLCVAPLCALRQSVLPGDSGGPLIVDKKIVGINVGIIYQPKISIFTPISPYMAWIHQTIK